MKRTVTILIVLLLLVIAAATAALALSPYFLNKYKEPILKRAGEILHREIGLGKIRLTLFTGAGVRLQDVTISNAPGFREEPMLSLSDLDVKVKLLPLLRKKYEVTRIILREPRILLEKNAKGAFNFSDLAAGEKTPAPASEEKETGAASPSPAEALAGLLVSEFRVEGGDLAYYDAGSEPLREGVRIRNLDLRLEDVSLERAIPLTLAFGVNRESQDIRLSGTVGPLGPALDPEKVPLSLQMAVQELPLSSLLALLGESAPVHADKGDLSLATDLSGDLGSGLTVSGGFKARGVTLRDAPKGEILVQGLDAGLDQDLLLNLQEGKISVRKGVLSLDRARLDLTGTVDHLNKTPRFSLTLASNDIPLKGWDKPFPALAGIGLEGSVKAEGAVAGEAGAKIRVTLNLTSPQLQVRLPKEKTAEVQKEREFSAWILPAAEAAVSAKTPNDKPQGPSLPENIDLQGRIAVTRGAVDTVQFSDLKADYAKTGNQVSITDFSVKGFGEQGTATGTLQADLGPRRGYSLDLKTSHVDLSRLQNTFSTAKEKVAGDLTARLTLKGSGWTAEEVRKSLSGDGNFQVEQGALTNVNLEEKILSAMGQRFGLPVPTLARMFGIQISQGNQTPFDECRGDFGIAGGRIRVRDAILTSKDHGFSTQGDIGLDQELDLAARMILRRVGEVPDRKLTYYLVDEQNRKYIPFQVTGTTASPKVRVDMEALIKGQARQAVEKKKEQLKEKLKEKLGPGGEEIMKPLEKLFRF